MISIFKMIKIIIWDICFGKYRQLGSEPIEIQEIKLNLSLKLTPEYRG